MGERTDQIERQIAETRSELTDNVGELQDKVKSAVDWRKQFGERPGSLLAVAFGGGVVLSAILPSNLGTKKNAPARSSADEPTQSNAVSGKSSDVRHNIDAFTGALLGVAVKQASTFLDSLLPGFHQEFTRAKDKSSRNDGPIDVATTSPKPLAAKASA